MKRKRKIEFEKEHIDPKGWGWNYSYKTITDSAINNVIWEIIERMKTQGKEIEFYSFNSDFCNRCNIIIKCDKNTFINFAHSFTMNLGNRITKVKW